MGEFKKPIKRFHISRVKQELMVGKNILFNLN